MPNVTKKKCETQFSIYKVDYNRSLKYFKEELKINIKSYSELEKEIIDELKETISNKMKSEIINISDDRFKGIVFKTYHYPLWQGMIDSILKEKIELSNTHISYILSYLRNDNLFLLTGGLGSNYISEYTQKNYGLYLLPKIMKENSPVVKTVLEDKMSGNKISSKHSNRNSTTINIENDMSSIFRELSLEINDEIVDVLDIDLEEDRKIKNLNIVAKDSFVIRKSISLENLIKVLNRLIIIEKKEDNFTLGYFVDIKKYGYSSKKLNEILLDDLVNKKLDNFLLIGDNYLDYCIGANKYIVSDLENKVVYESDVPITIDAIFENCLPEKITKTSVDMLLKYTLSVSNDNDITLFPTKLKQCLQGHIEDENKVPFFLFNGNWLMFDNKYINNLDIEYKNNYNQMINIDEKLYSIISNKDDTLTEDLYNKKFDDSNDIIVSHTVLNNNIELADLIYYDEKNLYLIHNKLKFQGNGVRDVLNQILTSSTFIKHYLYEKNRKEIFEKYYDDIIKKYPNNQKIKSLSRNDFISLFEKPNIYYIAGFIKGLSENTTSNYAKYIILNANKKLMEKGYRLLLFNINN